VGDVEATQILGKEYDMNTTEFHGAQMTRKSTICVFELEVAWCNLAILAFRRLK